MAQYRLKKDTFGVPAGTIATLIAIKHDEPCYELFYYKEEGANESKIYLQKCVVEQSDDFEKVEEPKKDVPKKWARAAYVRKDGEVGWYDGIYSSKTDVERGGASPHTIIWPAHFDEDGYLITEDE